MASDGMAWTADASLKSGEMPIANYLRRISGGFFRKLPVAPHQGKKGFSTSFRLLNRFFFTSNSRFVSLGVGLK